MTDPTFLFFIMLGPAMGSFICLAADRLPRGESLLRPGSTCRACERRLGVLDLIPILSFALTRGRCRTCHTTIPPWHLYTEVIATGAGVLAVVAGGPPLVMALHAAFLWCLLALALSDLLWMRLPDLMTTTLFGIALAIGGHSFGIPMAFIGAALGSGSFLALRFAYQHLKKREGLGLGDVKLMAGLGAFSGPFDLPLLVLIAALAGLAGAMLQPGKMQATSALPFGAALAGAAAILWIMRQGLI